MEAPDLLANAAGRFPSLACTIEADRSHTFAQTDERASRAAAALLAAGVRAGDRVALLAENELEYIELIAAAQRAGVVLVPLNYRLTVPELSFILADSSPKVLIHGPGYTDTATRLGIESVWHLGRSGAGDGYEGRLDAARPLPHPVLDAAAPSAIMYTSGTTGRAKGALLSNGAVAARVAFMALETGARPGDIHVQTLPMFHIAANTSCAFTYRAATNVMVRRFEASEVIRVLAHHRATHILLVPTTINLLCEELAVTTADLSALRMVLYGASPIPPEVLRRAIGLLGCGFLQFFGMTETSGCTLLRPEDHDPVRHPERLASAGTEAPSFAVRVVDAADAEVPAGTVGEIVCRGPAVMDGYWNAPETSAEVLRGGWMHTGDMGYRAPSGYLYVTDRLKDMIVTGGENVYPREVEDVLYEHPAVLEAAVIGIPDERWGETVHALVVARGEAPSTEELLTHARDRLARYKVPKSMELVASLPHNATGKVLKRELRERYWSGMERRVS